jgi:hypothetical protein
MYRSIRRTRIGLAVAMATLTAAPAMASARIYFSNGNASGGYTKRYEPSYIPFGNSSFLIHLHREHWNSRMTSSGGTLERNSCKPDCAGGTPSYWPIHVQLSRIRPCQGVEQYTVMTFEYVDRRPPGLAPTYSAPAIPCGIPH